MRGLAIYMIILPAWAIPAVAQVDTLQLVEIGSIEAPGEITNLYIEDLDGDSLKEIILTTASNVHIYDGITYEHIWTSPELDHPGDLLFADINLDGFIDFSVKDTANVHLFDPHNDATIWTSPTLDSTYECYTIGDRNDDDWADLAIVSKEPFSRLEDPDNLDTARVSIYDGPDYENESSLVLLLPNSHYHEGAEHHRNREEPAQILFGSRSDLTCRQDIVYLFTDLYNDSAFYNYTYEKNSGKLRIISSSNFEVLYIGELGRMNFVDFDCVDGSMRFYVLTGILECFNAMWDSWYDLSKVLTVFSADTLISSSVLWYSDYWIDWIGFTVGDISNDNVGEEIAYGAGDSLQLFSFPYPEEIWKNDDVTGVSFMLDAYESQDIFSTPQVVCGSVQDLSEYQFFSGSDGSLTAVLRDFDYPISRVNDVDNDDNDEILSLNDAELHIYGLRRTAVEDELPLPDRALLLSNFPNPFNSTTIIEYGLPEAGHVTIEIYDLLGRKVETLADEEQDAGHHRVTWDAGERTSGVYFCKITAGDKAETRRMVLLK